MVWELTNMNKLGVEQFFKGVPGSYGHAGGVEGVRACVFPYHAHAHNVTTTRSWAPFLTPSQARTSGSF
jgi:hypothetical protein